MSSEQRHLRFLITSALLVGPALGCGGTEAEPNTPTSAEARPAGNPVGPEPQPRVVVEPDRTGNPAGPEPEFEAVPPRPYVNTRPDPDLVPPAGIAVRRRHAPSE